VLAERLGRASEAIETLDRLVTCYPEYARGYAGRGVLLARLGRREAAQRDARDSLLRDTGLPIVYQVAAAPITLLDGLDHPTSRRVRICSCRGPTILTRRPPCRPFEAIGRMKGSSLA
jgi:eukaryotic-like serine/threonine-protein kinase